MEKNVKVSNTINASHWHYDISTLEQLIFKFTPSRRLLKKGEISCMNIYYDLYEGSQLKTVKCIAEISKCQTLVNRHGHDRLVTIENNIDN